jgi:hypothetical protein
MSSPIPVRPRLWAIAVWPVCAAGAVIPALPMSAQALAISPK